MTLLKVKILPNSKASAHLLEQGGILAFKFFGSQGLYQTPTMDHMGPLSLT